MSDGAGTGLFDRPTSIVVLGECRSLLNWVAYALAVRNPGGFVWTDIELDGEVREKEDLLGRSLLPRNRFFEVPPNFLTLDQFAGNVALTGLVRSGTPPEPVELIADFLRLPEHARQLISRLPREGPPPLFVLSNCQRLSAFYTWETAGPAIRAVLRAGASLLLTWAEAPTQSRLQFEQVFHLEGNLPAGWRHARLRVERGALGGPLRTGAELRVGEWEPIARVLEKELP